jgi:RNA polymerase sigma-70 factor (ECF subfamily)
MQTSGEISNFQLQHAEVPHKAVAIALMDAPVADSDLRLLSHQAMDAPSQVDALVERAIAGDGAALEELLVAMRPRAMSAALKILHNRDDAEDAVQEAFLKVWRCLSSFERRSSFSTWIHRIVTNSSLDVLRRNGNRVEPIERTDRQDKAVEIEPSHEQTPESELSSYQIQLLVRMAVASLPSAHRQAVELREFEDYSYQEMADIIQCPIGTVMSRLHHARNKLADDLRAPLGDSFELFAA